MIFFIKCIIQLLSYFVLQKYLPVIPAVGTRAKWDRLTVFGSEPKSQARTKNDPTIIKITNKKLIFFKISFKMFLIN